MISLHSSQWAVLTVVIALVAWLFAAAFIARARAEFGAQLAELIALASRRQKALTGIDGLLRRAQANQRGARHRAIQSIADYLERGAPLSQALASAKFARFSRGAIASLRATDGTAAQPAALESMVRQSRGALAARDRILLAALYPALLAMAVLMVHGQFQSSVRAFEYTLETTVGSGLGWLTISVAGVGLLLLAYVVALSVRSTPGSGPIRRRSMAEERFLRIAAELVHCRMPLGQLLARAGFASAVPAFERRANQAAALANSGAAPDIIWQSTPISEAARARTLAAGSSDPTRIANALRASADDCRRRSDSRLERTLTYFLPIVLSLFGVAVVRHLQVFFNLLEQTRATAMEVSLW